MAFNGTDLKTHQCPQCKKYRLYWPIAETPSLDNEILTLADGTQQSFYKDICEFCKLKNYNKYFKPKPADIKKVLKALKEGKSEQSLEELL